MQDICSFKQYCGVLPAFPSRGPKYVCEAGHAHLFIGYYTVYIRLKAQI